MGIQKHFGPEDEDRRRLPTGTHFLSNPLTSDRLLEIIRRAQLRRTSPVPQRWIDWHVPPRAPAPALPQLVGSIQLSIKSISWLTRPKIDATASQTRLESAKIRKSNIILQHTTPRGPNSVMTET